MTPDLSLDYSRIWSDLDRADLDQRITEALTRLASGETLAQVSNTWRVHRSTLCRALLAYAPTEWRRALTARALVRYLEAYDHLIADNPRNTTWRARVAYARWHLEHALTKLTQTQLRVAGEGRFSGPCNECGGEWSVSVSRGPAQCIGCGWRGPGDSYLARIIAEAM